MNREESKAWGFVVCTGIVCVAVMTIVHFFLRQRLEFNRDEPRCRAVLQAVGLTTNATGLARNEAYHLFRDHVSVTARYGNVHVYRVSGSDAILGHAVDVHCERETNRVSAVLGIGQDGELLCSCVPYANSPTNRLSAQARQVGHALREQPVPVATAGAPGFLIAHTIRGENILPPPRRGHYTLLTRAINRSIALFLLGEHDTVELDIMPITRPSPLGWRLSVGRLLKSRKLPANFKAERPRRVFWMPVAVTNVALGRPVTSSCPEKVSPDGATVVVTDNDRRSGKGDCVELDYGPQWVQVDLGQTRDVYAIAVWHDHYRPRVYMDIIVQIADDGEFTRNVRTLFNNDDDNSSGQGEGSDPTYYTSPWPELADARGTDDKPARTRHVRVWTNDAIGGQPPRFVEVAVYGM